MKVTFYFDPPYGELAHLNTEVDHVPRIGEQVTLVGAGIAPKTSTETWRVQSVDWLLGITGHQLERAVVQLQRRSE